ncbi:MULTISPECIES: copper homeostasis protein CutC [Metabacillus]|uniref:copper homeostasis protein CutC n=1 Tax=Metabacillus TaxID=2675233 RepID=UPI001CBFC234|nr:hypothetical protein MGI18_08595 [Bacillus sp. OVS6]USK29875.1 hypothetical protein LIT32_07130 [Bacillus sp. CMF21]
MEGGLTPSYGLIISVCSGLTIPVNVMIRASKGLILPFTARLTRSIIRSLL